MKKSLQFGWVKVGVGGSVNVDTTAKCNIVTNSDKNLFQGKVSLLENFLVGSALSIETTFSVPPGTDYGRQESL